MDNSTKEHRIFGARLRGLREAAGLTQATLGRKVGYSTETVRMIELGHRRARIEFALACDEALSTGGTLTEIVREHMDRRSLVGALLAAPLGIDTLKAPGAAESALRYALHLSDVGQLPEANTWMQIATSLADWVGDPVTQGYVRARSAVRGHFTGWTRRQVVAATQEAAHLSPASRVVGESAAAWVQIHVDDHNVTAARAAAHRMLDSQQSPAELSRAVAFHNYVEGTLGELDSALRAFTVAEPVLKGHDDALYAEARLYRCLAFVRAGDKWGVVEALDTLSKIDKPIRMITMAAGEVVRHVPADWNGDEVAELRSYANVGA